MGVVKVVVWSWNEMVRQEWGGGPGAEAVLSTKHRPGRRGRPSEEAVRSMMRQPGRQGRPGAVAIRPFRINVTITHSYIRIDTCWQTAQQQRNRDIYSSERLASDVDAAQEKRHQQGPQCHQTITA